MPELEDAPANPAHTDIVATNVARNMPLPHAVLTAPVLDRGLLPSIKSPLPTPIIPGRLDFLLVGYPLRQFVVDGFVHGFRVGYAGPPISKTFYNHTSAFLHPQVIQEYLKEGLLAQRIGGPFTAFNLPFTPFRSSPLAVVPKQDPGKFRIILNCSYPKDFDSVNHFIPKAVSTVKYHTMDEIIANILYLGRDSLIAKSDVRNAFRIIPLSPADYWLMGFQWEGKF